MSGETHRRIKPVLVGESVGAEELSSVVSRHPERISGLIYLEAAYQYAFDIASAFIDPQVVSVDRKAAAVAN
jgi:non-heme chloroperoxidase